MAEPAFLEGLSEEEIEALAAWMVERETRQYYAGGHLPWGPTQQAIPQAVVPTAVRAMSRDQKLAKAAQALAMMDPQTLGRIAPQAYMAKQIIESVKLPSAEPERPAVPEGLQEELGIAPTQPTTQQEEMPQFGPSAPTRMMGGQPKPWEVTGRTPPEPNPFADLAGLTGEELQNAIKQKILTYAMDNRLFARDAEGNILTDEFSPEVAGLLSYLQLFGEGGLGGAGGGGLTAYQSAQLGIQQQQLENERERIRQAMIGLGITGAGQMGTLTQQGANLAKEAALYALPPGTQYMPGLEPGGPASRFYGAVGAPFTPVPAAGTMVNPYAGAEKGIPLIEQYLRQLGLGG